MTFFYNSGLGMRENIPERYRWRLEDIYHREEVWENDIKRAKMLTGKADVFRGRVGESQEALLGCLKLRDETLRIIDKLYVYSHMRRDENNANPLYQALSDKVEHISHEVDREFSFIIPEIIKIPENRIMEFMEKSRGLKLYSHHINEIIRIKKHTLSPEQEMIISMTGGICSGYENAYRALVNADIRFPAVNAGGVQEVELSEARYYELIRSEHRSVRQEAFFKLHSTYKKYGNTLAAMLDGAIKKDIFHSKVKNYNSSIEAALVRDNIPVNVYDNILNLINSNLNHLHRYMEIKKNALKIDKVQMYDLDAPLVNSYNMRIPYEKAVNIVKEALRPLGKEYGGILDKSITSRWIDVFENPGKTHGAYSWGAYDTYPYVLLNYSGTLSDVFTIAHELGHSVHSYFTSKSQPYVYSKNTLFTAEVASITNEVLLVEYLLKTNSSKDERVYIINHYLESIRTTLFRQAMFSEFEKKVHEAAASGDTLTCQFLCSLWHHLNVKYYGNNVDVDEDSDIEWARIPHFYRSFYVYKYVTGYAAAVSLSRGIFKEGEKAVKRYIKFLKGGDSDYSIDLLKAAGVDMTTSQPIEDTIGVFEGLLNQIEKMLD